LAIDRLGRNLIAAWPRRPAGEFINLAWPGYVGVITAAAPGRALSRSISRL